MKQIETNSTIDQIRTALAVIDDRKGMSVRLLDVRGKSSVTDFLVIASGTSDPHLKAMKLALEKAFADAGVPLSVSNPEIGSGWIVIDVFDFMIHLQTEAMREFYQLEKMWQPGSATAS